MFFIGERSGVQQYAIRWCKTQPHKVPSFLAVHFTQTLNNKKLLLLCRESRAVLLYCCAARCYCFLAVIARLLRRAASTAICAQSLKFSFLFAVEHPFKWMGSSAMSKGLMLLRTHKHTRKTHVALHRGGRSTSASIQRKTTTPGHSTPTKQNEHVYAHASARGSHRPSPTSPPHNSHQRPPPIAETPRQPSQPAAAHWGSRPRKRCRFSVWSVPFPSLPFLSGVNSLVRRAPEGGLLVVEPDEVALAEGSVGLLSHAPAGLVLLEEPRVPHQGRPRRAAAELGPDHLDRWIDPSVGWNDFAAIRRRSDSSIDRQTLFLIGALLGFRLASMGSRRPEATGGLCGSG